METVAAAMMQAARLMATAADGEHGEDHMGIIKRAEAAKAVPSHVHVTRPCICRPPPNASAPQSGLRPAPHTLCDWGKTKPSKSQS